MPDNRREAEREEYQCVRDWLEANDEPQPTEATFLVGYETLRALLDSQQGGVWLSEEEAEQVLDALGEVRAWLELLRDDAHGTAGTTGDNEPFYPARLALQILEARALALLDSSRERA